METKINKEKIQVLVHVRFKNEDILNEVSLHEILVKNVITNTFIIKIILIRRVSEA